MIDPIYKQNRNRVGTTRGLCKAQIFTTGEDFEEVELTYEAEDNGDGWEVYCTRPDVANASDLLADVTETLHSDGLQDIAKIYWL